MEGSKNITVEVQMTELLNQMKDHSYYIGEALKSAPELTELGAKLQASNDDDATLQDFINNGVAKVANLLTRVLGITTFKWENSGTKKVTFTTKAVVNFPEGQTDAMKGVVTNYLSCFCLSSWLKLVKPDESLRFDEMRRELETEIVQLSAQRSKPTRS